MRNSHLTLGIFWMVLAITSLAAAQSSTTNSPGHRPPETPSQTVPSQPVAPPDTSAGKAQSQAHTGDENPLNLTDDQKARLQPIIVDEKQQMDALRSNTTMTQEQKISKANEIRQASSPKIRAILTPEQLQKLDDLQKAQHQQNQTAAPPDKTPPPQ